MDIVLQTLKMITFWCRWTLTFDLWPWELKLMALGRFCVFSHTFTKHYHAFWRYFISKSQ